MPFNIDSNLLAQIAKGPQTGEALTSGFQNAVDNQYKQRTLDLGEKNYDLKLQEMKDRISARKQTQATAATAAAMAKRKQDFAEGARTAYQNTDTGEIEMFTQNDLDEAIGAGGNYKPHKEFSPVKPTERTASPMTIIWKEEGKENSVVNMADPKAVANIPWDEVKETIRPSTPTGSKKDLGLGTASQKYQAAGTMGKFRSVGNLAFSVNEMAINDPAAVGASGSLSETIQNVYENTKNFMSQLGDESGSQESWTSPDGKYDWIDSLSGTEHAVLRSQTYMLVYNAMSAIAGQEGRALSDNDIKRGLDMVTASNPKSLSAVINSYSQMAYTQFRYSWEELNPGEEFPHSYNDWFSAGPAVGTSLPPRTDQPQTNQWSMPNPNGGTIQFPSQEQMNAFKRKYGLQ